MSPTTWWAGACPSVRRITSQARSCAGCLEAGESLAQVPLEDLRALSPAFDEGYYDLHEPAAQLARKCSRGGSAPWRVREQLQLALTALDAHLCC